MLACLSDEDLAALVDGAAVEADRAAALLHADGCAACRELLAATARTVAGPALAGDEDPEAPIARGVSVGRYVVMDLAGAGASGEVHVAYDPELHRKIALKLLHATEQGPRLLREAQAMAQLSHPNVVTVYDAGTFGRRLFVAMELVVGRTLRAWKREAPRPWRQVLAVLVDAGRGLAAAHAVGIVHRDFKPDNVLVGADGRARVADFGLARLSSGGADGPQPLPPGARVGGALTRTGALLGTPAYMAPEQLRGEPATAAADQYSFCVTLYEALTGRRPFAGDRIEALLDAATREELAPDARLPAWVRRPLVRGLKARPEERFPSMTALLAALTRDPGRLVRRGVAAAAASIALALALLVPRGDRAAMCRGGAAELAGVWSPARRDAVSAALLAGHESYAPAAFASFAGAIDAHAGRWAAMYTEACEATHVRGEQSAELLDRRMECLRRDREELDATLALFAQPAPGRVDRAVRAAFGLPVLEACSADAVLRRQVAPPADAATRARVEATRAALGRARALLRAGQFEAGLGATRDAAATARATGYLPVVAEALLLLGNALTERRQLPDALAVYDEALEAATAAGAEGVAAQALKEKVRIVGFLEDRRAEAAAPAQYADALAQRLGDQETVAAVGYFRAIFAFQDGAYGRARDGFQRALELRRKVYGPQHPLVAQSVSALGMAERMLGHSARALADQREALAMHVALLGPDHPDLAVDLTGIALIEEEEMADYAGARAHFARALELKRARGDTSPEVGSALTVLADADLSLDRDQQALDETDGALRDLASLPAEHVDVAHAHFMRGEALHALGRDAEALVEHERALAIRRALHGMPAEIVSSLSALARVEMALGRPAVAVARGREAMALVTLLFPPGHPAVGPAHTILCQVLVDAQRSAEAVDVCSRALMSAAAAYGPAHPLVAAAWTGLGAAWLDLGRVRDARPPLEQAVALLSGRAGDAPLKARARAALARALSR